MRRMRLTLALLAVIVIGLAASTTTVLGQAGILLNLTNQVWKYDESNTDYYSPVPPFFDPTFDDSLWLDGRAIFVFETSTGANLNANVYPYTNTVLSVGGGKVTYYFRTHFTFTGDPANYVLTASNLIDDGYVMYLNGVEVSRFNMIPGSGAPNHLSEADVANPNGEGVYVVRQLNIPAGVLINGDNVLAVSMHQDAPGSSDVVWGTWLHASLGYAPRILSPTSQVDMNVVQGLNTNLTVTVDAAPTASIQWFFDADKAGPNAPVAISGATAATYTITEMDPSEEGHYFAQASNSLGTSNSPIFNVTYIADTTAPTVVSAVGDVGDVTLVTVTFSENVLNANDYLFYYLDATDMSGALAVVDASYGTSSNIIVLITDPRDPAKTYDLYIQLHSITDFYGNPLADPTVKRVTVPTFFQEGVAGYDGTRDTELSQNAPDAALGGNTGISVDLEDPVPNQAQGLLKFENVFGSGVGQVPLGATVTSATLRMYTFDPGGGPVRMLRMVAPWDESSTWNSMVNGIDDTNGVEAAGLDATIITSPDEAFDSIDVTTAVQAWANGEPNQGWAFLASTGNGWDWSSSENGTVANRPSLLVEFTVVESPCQILDQPDSVAVDECDGFTLSVGASGTGLTYQWSRNGTDIPGATAATYTVNNAKPTLHGGTYRVVVSGTIQPSPCTSDPATVTITPDTARPTVVSALGNPDQTTITITFADQCPLNQAEAENTANYTVSGGVTVNSAVLNGMVVTLTTSARTPPNNYSLTIRDIHDTAENNNVLDPNPTVISTLVQHVRLLAHDATWRYHNEGADLYTDGTWKDVGYNDSAWLSGQALLGFEPSGGTRTALFNQGWNTNNLFLLSRTNSTGGGLNGTNITDYFRTTVNIPFSLAGATIRIRHVTDDGGVYYFNGAEVARSAVSPGQVTYLTEANAVPAEGVTRNINGLSGLATGDNTIAVSVHQGGTPAHNSSDITFGLELIAIYGATPPTLSIVNNGNGTVTISWTPAGGTLQQSTDLTNWVASGNQANPQTIPATGLMFFRIAP